MVWPGERTHINKQTNIQTYEQTYQQNRSFQNWALYYSIVGPVKNTKLQSVPTAKYINFIKLDGTINLRHYYIVLNLTPLHIVPKINSAI